ncbi:17333_t:CDS:2, partial [Cetraspora pellucida]
AHRQEILYTSLQQKKIIQPECLNFIIDKKPWYSLQLYNINYIILQLESDKLMLQEMIQDTNIQIEVFKNAKLKSEIIIRALPLYYKAPYYSNVAIKLDKEEQQLYINDYGYCYVK